MKKNLPIFCFLLFFCLYPLYNYASSEYQQVNTSQGKVVVGLDRERALEIFGPPASITENLWYYSHPEGFFIYFSPASVLTVYLYPRFCEGSVNVPIEFKAFGHFSDFKTSDITTQAELLLSEPQDFIVKKPGIIIPRKEGKYQVLMKYKDVLSNAGTIIIKKSPRSEDEKERLLAIDILPFKPIVPWQTRLEFIALGTFLDSSEEKYFIRDISHDAQWFIKQGESILSAKDNQISFDLPGKFKVFCKYRDLESFSQEVKVQRFDISQFKPALKHIMLLPDFISVTYGKKINLVALGTDYHNKVEDITYKASWNILDKDTLAPAGNGEFLSKSPGITEVIAQVDNLESLPAKIIVSDKKEASSILADDKKPQEVRVSSNDLIRDIKNDAKIASKSLVEERRLRLVKIIPDYLTIPLGEHKQLVALGIYSDNSQEDFTLLAEWKSSDDKVATVSKGKIDTYSPGEAKVYAKIQGINSLPASIIVEGPKLVSINVLPKSLRITMKDKLSLKAEGYFTDSSRRDITSLVNWKIANPRIVKIDKGTVRPLRIGETQAWAEYSQVKSLPSNIKVVFSMDWLISMIIRTVSFLILGIIIIFFVLYYLTEREKKKLRLSLDKNPRGFIVSLYNNTKKILAIFGLSHRESLAPLSYAALVQERLSLENGIFLDFTVRFEEAKYSSHVLQPEAAITVLNDYNGFLKILFRSRSKFSLFIKYCLTLFKRVPVFITLG